MSKKTLEKWEIDRGFIFVGDIDLSQKLTEGEFVELIIGNDFTCIGVDHKERIEFLKSNGYEVTRENMINADLSVRPEYHTETK